MTRQRIGTPWCRPPQSWRRRFVLRPLLPWSSNRGYRKDLARRTNILCCLVHIYSAFVWISSISFDVSLIPKLFYRPAGIYVMDRLELGLITSHPSVHAADIVVLIGSFSVPAGLRVAKAAISRRKNAMLLQQSAWQNNVRMGDLVEKIWSSFSSVSFSICKVHIRKTKCPESLSRDRF